jgi:hypothetical protein
MAISRRKRRNKDVNVTHTHIHLYDDTAVLKLLTKISNQNIKIMAKIDDLNAKVAELQETVNTEQQEISNALGLLNTEIESLKAIIAQGSGVTDEQIQAVIDNIDGIIADVKTSIPNLPEPEPPME